LDWLRCIIVMFDLLAQPNSSIPYVQLGLIIVLYKSTLLSSDMMDLCPIIQYMSFTLESICFLFLAICCFHVSLESKWSPRYFTVDHCGSAVLFRYTAGQFPFFSVKLTCIDLFSLMIIRHNFSQLSWWSRWLCNLLVAATGSSWLVRITELELELEKKKAQIGTSVRDGVFNAGLLTRSQFASGRSCDRRIRSRFSVVFLGSRVNVDLVPKFHVALHASHATLPMVTPKISS
jgi:hypothetical protein